MRMTRIVIWLSLACALAPLASAQLKKAPSAVGTWEFETAELYDSCVISGEMQIAPAGAKDPKHYTCSFKAVQACKRGFIRTIHTDQSCSATQTGSQVTITSKVDRIVATDPGELMRGMSERYAPDNFDVAINLRGDEMDGMFESRGTAPVKFRRKQELVS